MLDEPYPEYTSEDKRRFNKALSVWSELNASYRSRMVDTYDSHKKGIRNAAIGLVAGTGLFILGKNFDFGSLDEVSMGVGAVVDLCSIVSGVRHIAGASRTAKDFNREYGSNYTYSHNSND